MKVGNYREYMATWRRNREAEDADSKEDEHRPQGLFILSEFGGNICNSVTLHKFESTKPALKQGLASETVYAVLTNNNKTVRIVDLDSSLVVRTLDFEDPVNHSSISPNGKFLVVVGDMRNVFFYEIHSPDSCFHAQTELIQVGPNRGFIVGLEVHRPAHISTSFSPSSRYCAVASQDGGVFIFDTMRLWEGREAAVVKEIMSPRSATPPGALRSIQFSSEPWDLLIWAENSGRVSISDGRRDFEVRQTIDVNFEGEDIVHAEVRGTTEEEAYTNLQAELDRRRDERNTAVLLNPYATLHEYENEPYSERFDTYDIHSMYASRRDRMQTYEALRTRAEGWNSMLPPVLPSSTTVNSQGQVVHAAGQNVALPSAPSTTQPGGGHSSYRNMRDRRPREGDTIRARLQQHQFSSYLTPMGLPSTYITPPPAPSAPHSAAVSRQPSRQPSVRTLRDLAGDPASFPTNSISTGLAVDEYTSDRSRVRRPPAHRIPTRRDTIDSERAALMYNLLEPDEPDITGCTMSGDGRKL